METATSGAATVDRPEEAHLVRDVAGVGARLGKGHKEETEYEPDGKSAGVAPSRKLPGPATAAGPAEARPWHRDPFHRVTVVLSGDLLNIEFRDGGEAQSWKIRVGEVDWAEQAIASTVR